ncbi:MAG: thioredoxin [Bacteroidia bacterium]|nr:MAG: thioredoxin [Bacteroidia bacterium]
MKNLIIGNKDNFESLINSGKISVVDFWAEWCGPCKMQLPILENFAKENPDIQVIKINVDENIDLANSYEIINIPTIIYFDKSGKKVKKTIGLQKNEDLNKIKEELK